MAHELGRRLLAGTLLLALAQASLALTPYFSGDKQAAGEVKAQIALVERKLQDEDFVVVGRHQPRGLPQHGSVIVTDRALLDAVRSTGGVAIVGSCSSSATWSVALPSPRSSTQASASPRSRTR